jgi:hypothetical protein
MAALPRPNRVGIVFVFGLLALSATAGLRLAAAAGQAPPADTPISGLTPPGGVPAIMDGPGVADLKAMTVEQLITALADLKARKAELEKQEKELTEAVKAKLKEHKNRLHQLGVPLDEDLIPAPVVAPLASCLPCSPVSPGRH